MKSFGFRPCFTAALVAALLCAAPSVINAKTLLVLQCEHTYELNSAKQDDYLFIEEHSARFRTDYPNETREVTYAITEETDEQIVGRRIGEDGEPQTLRLNRITGYMRVDYRISDEIKPKLWNQRDKKMGFDLDEEVWLGFSLHCVKTKRRF